MPILLAGALALALAAPPPQAGPSDKPDDRSVTLSGCVTRSRTPQAPLTFAETASGDKYKLSGRGLGKYVGKRVEIVGGAPGRRLTIRGGLLPSPNVAAQAGAMDTAQVAIANMAGAMAGKEGGVELPEFHVTRVKLLDGACQ
ncbi:MAG: hypothetical protein ABL993_08015 [Vicinamibacterales bacterium]